MLAQEIGTVVSGRKDGEILIVLQMAMAGGITYDRLQYFIFANATYSELLNNLFMKLGR